MGNNPIYSVDPTGLAEVDACQASSGGVVSCSGSIEATEETSTERLTFEDRVELALASGEGGDCSSPRCQVLQQIGQADEIPLFSAIKESNLLVASTLVTGVGGTAALDTAAGRAAVGATEQAAAVLARDLLNTRLGRRLIGKGGLLNSGRHLRLGFGRKGGRETIRLGGDFVERLTGRAHIDLLDLGQIRKYK